MEPNRSVRKGALALDEVLNDIEVPSLDVPDLDASFCSATPAKDLFAEKERAAWKDVQQAEARCDFAPNKVRISYRNPQFGIISLWKKSLYGRTLTDIKSDPDMVEKFAEGMNTLIRQILGHSLATGDWAIVTSPKRRHKVRNFASLISARLADLLGIPFYEDVAECHSKHRVGAVFTFGAEPPKEANIIVFDDFVTTGATMISMRELLMPLQKNLVFFTGINNKLCPLTMDHKFTEQIKQWLEKPETERDYSVGALYLLKLSGNQIMYKNIIAQIDRRHDVVDYQLQKYYNFRVQALTHAQVEEMAAQVETIVAEHIPLAANADQNPAKGRRADHDSLPDEIKAKYVENLSLLQRMRELHLRLRSLSLENSTCPDSERYPFLKELISLDKKLHANWEAYDRYVIGQSDEGKSRKPAHATPKKKPRNS